MKKNAIGVCQVHGAFGVPAVLAFWHLSLDPVKATHLVGHGRGWSCPYVLCRHHWHFRSDHNPCVTAAATLALLFMKNIGFFINNSQHSCVGQCGTRKQVAILGCLHAFVLDQVDPQCKPEVKQKFL
jgi:hypothetical protein